MSGIHKFFCRHHIFGSVIVTAVFWLVMIIASFGFVILSPRLAFSDSYLLQCLVELLLAAVGFGLAALFGYHRIWRARGSGFLRGLLAGGYFIFISVYSLMLSLWQLFTGEVSYRIISFGDILIFILTMFLVGFAEEVFFRGIVANLFLDKLPRNKYGVWCAVIGSGLVFGLMHAGNAISVAPGGALVQTFVAAAMGMALSAIYYRSRNIWAVIFIHAFVDFCALAVPTIFSMGTLTETIGSYSAAQFIGIVPYILVCMVLLRKSKMNTICPFPDDEMRQRSEDMTKPVFKKYLITACVVGTGIIAAYILTSI